jgi:transposase
MEEHRTKKTISEPQAVRVYEFGAVMSLHSVASRLGIGEIIDKTGGKRTQGLPLSTYMMLATINRVVGARSKNTIYEWFDKTALRKIYPEANRRNLSSQGFWNNMSALDEEKIRQIEDEITKRAVERYGMKIECLLFDNTNFYTYIDTSTQSSLAKRGHCKQKRTDLKIVGLSLMVSPEHNIPLFHEVYPGNRHDAQQFCEVIEKLKHRYRKLGKGDCSVTLVFDKGNNNEENIQKLVEVEPCPFHFVGGLRLSQCPELLDVANSEFTRLGGDLGDVTAYRSSKNIYERELTVLVTHNPELKKAQMDGVLANIAACEVALSDLRERLRLRREGYITRGKMPTVESTKKNVANILSAEHMGDIFDCTVTGDPGETPELLFALNEERWLNLQERSLGKSILFTDHDDWSNVQIVNAYRSQYHVEDAFKQMKDTKYLSFRPVRHFTDNHIRVHAFYCVLALLLASLLNKELEIMGHKMSIRAMLDSFADVQQVVSLFSSSDVDFYACTSYSRLEGIPKLYIDHHHLTDFFYT